MEFRVLNWNVGGAKFLETREDTAKTAYRRKVNDALRKLVADRDPHVIMLQEIVEFKKPNQKGPPRNIIDPPAGYAHYHCILIDSDRYPYVSKWKKVQVRGKWPARSYFGQGNAMLWRKKLPHFPVYSLPKISARPDHCPHVHDVVLMSGLYFGDRDTEPRAALVAHFVITKNLVTGRQLKKPLDVFLVNLHLTTMMGEREGIPQIDSEGRRTRFAQLDIVLNGIVSRYNIWRRAGYPFRNEPRKAGRKEDFDRYSPIWILAGDFNFTPQSSEYGLLARMNFVDVHLDKGQGTKGKWFGFKGKPTITCDYIFAGPKYTSLDPLILEQTIKNNPKPLTQVRVSDHYPLFAAIPLTTLT
jgi:endonuclease/exonuclease/phosphatase family metal-dependent hydrolase